MTQEQYVLLEDKAHIHLIEDDLDDVFLLKRLLSDQLSNFEIHVHGNGREALDYLEHNIEDDDTVDLILLDINMPIMNGFEFLKNLRQMPRFKLVPTIVVTTADDPVSTKTAYECGANSVVTKGKLLLTVPKMVGLMVDYWLTLAEIPDLLPVGSEQ